MTVIAEDSERVELDLVADSAGAVVFERAPLPIYRAFVDGAPATVEIANVQRTAVRVSAGRHRVVLETDRRPTRAAVGAACLGLLGLMGLAIAARRGTAEAQGLR